nr:PhzF family phenazine biosynthesis protein [Zavarzinella formosa]
MVRVLHVDAFSTTPRMGNPAGVVLDASGLDDEAMQHVAREVGFNETAFVLPSARGDLRLRYFTPGHEVNLCGHATVASFVALHHHGLLPRPVPCRLMLETLAGMLPIVLEIDPVGQLMVTMTQAPAQFVEFQGNRAKLARSLGVEEADFDPELPVVYGSTGLWTLVVPVRTLAAIRRMIPRNAEFPDVLAEMPTASVHPFCREVIDPQSHLHARHFSSPRSGTTEDPVTGTASGVLGAYYRKFIGSPPSPLVVEQGQEVGRDGRVLVWTDQRGEMCEVRIAGAGCLVGEQIVD